MRLLLPGTRANTNVKYLRRINLTERPTIPDDLTLSMTPTGWKNGAVFICSSTQSPLITQPAPELKLQGPGLYRSRASPGPAAAMANQEVEVSATGQELRKR